LYAGYASIFSFDIIIYAWYKINRCPRPFRFARDANPGADSDAISRPERNDESMQATPSRFVKNDGNRRGKETKRMKKHTPMTFFSSSFQLAG